MKKQPESSETKHRRNGKWEVADIFHSYGDAYRRKYPLLHNHKKVMEAIMTCRTEVQGGHLQQCDSCGFERLVFHSCRDRHCPKCQATVKARWLEARQTELLPVAYFHLVFTLPHELNVIALANKKELGNLLFRAVSQTLLEFGRDPKNKLGGKIGCIAILHTWDQKLLDHFHLHCLVPAGALSADGRTWIHPNSDYLFSVQALSVVFRGKYIDFFKKAYEKDRLNFLGRSKPFATERAFQNLLNSLWKKKWVVYCKPPLDKPKRLLQYLSRYVHRVAISNHRIVSVSNGNVTFTYKNRKNNTIEECTIKAVEFIRRFLLHVIPKDFMRIRSYGFLANRSKKKDLTRCKELLGVKTSPPRKKSTVELITEMIGIDITRCPHCTQGTMVTIKEIQPLSVTCTIDELFTLFMKPDTS